MRDKMAIDSTHSSLQKRSKYCSKFFRKNIARRC